MIRFIYFDVDDTLLDHRYAERKALEDVYHRFHHLLPEVPLSVFQDTYHRYNVRLWDRYAHGEIDKKTLRVERFWHMQEAFDLHEVPLEELIQTYMTAYAHHWKWIPGARDAFLELAQSTQVGLLTNGFAEVQHAKLRRFPELEAHARAIVISEEVGVMKPDPRIFTHATRQAGVPPEAILYVGDSYTSDVLGGHRAGWNVAWFRRQDVGSSEKLLPPGTYTFARWQDFLQWFKSVLIVS